MFLHVIQVISWVSFFILLLFYLSYFLVLRYYHHKKKEEVEGSTEFYPKVSLIVPVYNEEKNITKMHAYMNPAKAVQEPSDKLSK